MSKNHPHDNIYSILGKLDALKPTPEETRFALVKEIRESVEAKGSVLEGVDAVQAKLAQRFAESQVTEKAVSQAQQKFMGMVHAAQKGGKSASPEVARVAKDMGKKDAKDFASTKHAGLPKHVAEKYDPVKAVKQCAKNAMEMNGIASVHDLDAEDIEYIGDECQMNYHDVCEILGIQLPDSLGPVQSWDTDEQGNKFDLEEGTCNECGMFESECSCDHTNEGELTRKTGVTRHIKTDYPGYPADDLEKDDDNRTGPKAIGGRGRPRKASTVNPRPVAGAEKKGRGRPTKVKAPGASTLADPFSRVTGIAPKGKKGTVHSMDESFAHMENRFLMEMNFRKMEEETGRSMDELMSELQQDINHYKSTGHCSDKLKDFLSIHSHSKKQMADEAAMEAATQQPLSAPTNPHPVGSSLPANQIPGKANLLKGKGRDYYEEEYDPLEGELNELAKLAGLKVADEGAGVMHFKKQQAEKSGKDSFTLGDKEFPVDESDMEEGNAFSGKLAQAKAQHKDHFELGGKEIKVQEADVPVDAEPEEHANSPKEKYMSMKASTMNPGEADNGEKAMHPDRPTFKNGDNALAKPATSKATTLEAKLVAEYESIKKSI